VRNPFGRLVRRCQFFFSQTYWVLVSCLGIVLELVAVIFALQTPPSPLWAGVLGGIGSSILATVIVSFGGPSGNRTYQTFIRLGIEDFYPSRNDVPNETWVDSLRQARAQCILLGQAHGEWCDDPGFEDAVIERLASGVVIEVFFLDPTGKGIATRTKEDSRGTRNLEGRIRRSIKFMWDIRQKLQDPSKSRLKLYVYDATPSVGVTWIDSSMLVTHYLPGSVNLTSPALRIEPRQGTKSVYSVYQSNINTLRAEFSALLTDSNIGSFIT